MADYRVTANNTRDFQLLADEQALGTLHYTEWFSLKAVLTLPDAAAFQIEPKGVWGTTIELKDQQTVLLNFKMNWKGTIVIKQKDAYNTTSVTKLDGGNTISTNSMISKDGKTRTQTTSGTNAKGEKVDTVTVWEHQ